MTSQISLALKVIEEKLRCVGCPLRETGADGKQYRKLEMVIKYKRCIFFMVKIIQF